MITLGTLQNTKNLKYKFWATDSETDVICNCYHERNYLLKHCCVKLLSQEVITESFCTTGVSLCKFTGTKNMI